MLGEKDSKKAVAFLNHIGRPDSDLASLGHRDASSAKNFCNFYTGFFNVPRTRGTKGTPWDS